MNSDAKVTGKVHFAKIIGEYWLLIFTVLVFVVFSILLPNFAQLSSIFNMLASASIMAIASLGMTCVMAAGEIDLSLGAQVSIGAVLMGALLTIYGFNSFFLAAIVTILILMCIGAINVFLSVILKIPSFIATIGTSFIILGIAKLLTGERTIFNDPRWPRNYTVLGQGRLFGVVPYAVIALITVSIIIYIFTERTRWGKYLYLVGSNRKACDYLGINSAAQKLRGFLLCSVFAALAGIIRTSMLNLTASQIGAETLMNAVTVIMLGATFIKQGVYNVPGSIIAALMLTGLFFGLTMLGVPQYGRDIVQGIILVVSVSVVAMVRYRTERS